MATVGSQIELCVRDSFFDPKEISWYLIYVGLIMAAATSASSTMMREDASDGGASGSRLDSMKLEKIGLTIFLFYDLVGGLFLFGLVFFGVKYWAGVFGLIFMICSVLVGMLVEEFVLNRAKDLLRDPSEEPSDENKWLKED